MPKKVYIDKAMPPPKKMDKERLSHDIMNSRVMLPGSYGAGKRR
jgi:hypothetical protein